MSNKCTILLDNCDRKVIPFLGLADGDRYRLSHALLVPMQPVYEYCEKRGLPLMVHQGATFVWRGPLRYASPAQLDDVALAYPDLVMVAAHLGQPWIEETLVLHYRPWQFYNALIPALEYGVLHKLLFGSDYPF